MPAPFEVPALPSRPRGPLPTRFTPRTPSAALAQPFPSPSTRHSKGRALFANSQADPATACEAKSVSNDSIRNLLGGLVLAETFQTIAQAPLQRRRRVGIECHEIPQRLAAILAQPSKCRCIGVRMPRHVLTNRTIGMLRQLVQRLGIGSRVLADQPQQVKILFRRLLDKFLQHFRLCVRA